MKKSIFIFLLIVNQFIYLYGNEYKNLKVSEGVFYSGKVNISSGKKQYYNIWKIESNSIKTDKTLVVIHIKENTKVYSDYNKTSEDEPTQFIVDKNCDFIASGKFENKWIYIKIIENSYRWIPAEKVSFLSGTLNDLPELFFEEEYSDYLNSIYFSKNFVQIAAFGEFDGFPDDSEINEILPCTQTIDGKINYITFNNKKYLMLKNKSLISLINQDNKKVFYGVNGISPRRLEGFGYKMPDVFSASSELKEKNRIYSAKNLDNENGDNPWVEAVNGPGIGEYININYEDINALIISNGYVNYNKPYLYENNNRVKIFEVYNQDNKKIQELILQDTPNPQIFRITESCKSIKLVIKEIYKGNRWDDTCVNYIKIIPGFCSLEGFVLDN